MQSLRALALFAALSIGVGGCVYPTSKTEQGGVSSALSFAGLPPTASIAIDGTVVGIAGDYADKVLAVSPGTHRVRVQNSGLTLVDRDVYVGRDSTVEVSP